MGATANHLSFACGNTTYNPHWLITDIFNGLMAFPNLIALLALNGVVAAETKKYFDKVKSLQ